MKSTKKTYGNKPEILKYSLPGDSFRITMYLGDLGLDEDEFGRIPQGTFVPWTEADGTERMGVLLYDVDLEENPNGAIITEGYVDASVLPVQPTDEDRELMPEVKFV